MTSGQLPKVINRGDVVWVADPFDFDETEGNEGSDHPYLIISTDAHPFQGTEYLALLITSTDRELAVSLTDSHWRYGGLSNRSYVNPWTVVTLKNSDLDGYQGMVEEEIVDTAVAEIPQYIGLSLQNE
ncbi:type II toxin-antitoxin system PemK/MazF family toxin [Halostagnicola sp. A-GB9-2]|uniref:type II toxin-antitoxin system PemK/MazF family toxin n=1 Tax=Halostagnicola sp. A-GB9-2 TaxID=3048066 RepID=UPI0024C0BAC1|nr:type II toxin-antitoxin system PemK/MazF family toxin [Halostagnicola sp. A-GB9-2]MDJ1434229.1 type II toxin-antitoxin system PemK/MazF family toxin [Halostagnicola sp. A-GB9-2]